MPAYSGQFCLVIRAEARCLSRRARAGNFASCFLLGTLTRPNDLQSNPARLVVGASINNIGWASFVQAAADAGEGPRLQSQNCCPSICKTP